MTEFYTLFLILVAIDGVLTARILRKGGIERNPVMAWIMRIFGNAWPAVRMFVAAAAGIAIMRLGSPWPLAGLCAIWAWIVWHNWRESRR